MGRKTFEVDTSGISCISCFLLSSWLAFLENINLCVTLYIVLGIYLEPGVMATTC